MWCACGLSEIWQVAHTHITSDRGQQIRVRMYDVWHDASPARSVRCSNWKYYALFTYVEVPFVHESQESPLDFCEGTMVLTL